MNFRIDMSENPSNNKAFSMIADIDGDYKDLLEVPTPDELPILPVRNLVLFPGVVSPILIGRESSLSLIKKAEKKGILIGVVCQRDPEIEDPSFEDLYEYGVFAKVVKQLSFPNGNETVIVQSLGRLRLLDIKKQKPHLVGIVTPTPELQPDKRDKEWHTAVEDLRKLADEFVNASDEIPNDATFAIHNIHNEEMALNFVCTNMPFSIKEKMSLLSADSMKERLFGAMKALNREINLQNLRADIRNKTREDIDEQQKNYFLQQQIKNMQAEMGNESPEKAQLKEKALNKKWSEEGKHVLGTPFSQFLKLETNFCKTWRVGDFSSLVFHFYGGIMKPLGNDSNGPFSEQMYVGGANDLRGFSMRTIGPGSVHIDDSNSQYLYHNGDMKLVVNLEYRPRLFGSLYGALFLDAGNVWVINKTRRDMLNETYHQDAFKKDLAIDLGVGIRYDLDFFVLRLDWGFAIHKPYNSYYSPKDNQTHETTSGFVNVRNFKDAQCLNFAIGYPF